MGFRVSPGVNVKEIDLTTIVPGVATTPGGFAGYFHWGPVNEIVTVSSEREFSNIFGKPKTDNYVDFFTVSNFLQYGNNMQVVRTVGTGSYNANARADGTTSSTPLYITNSTQFGASAGSVTGTPAGANIAFSAKYPGVLGNSIKVVLVAGTGTTTMTLGPLS